MFPSPIRLQGWMDEGAIAMVEKDRSVSDVIAAEASRLRNFIRKRVPNEADAEDLLQEVFYELVAAYRVMEPVQRWSAWMFQVARNRIVDLFRKQQRHPAEADVVLLEDVLPSPDAGPAAAYARRLLLDELEEALDELPPEQREVFLAHEVEGRSFKEIAEQTGVSVNTLLSRKHYAVLHLRRRLRAIYQEFVR